LHNLLEGPGKCRVFTKDVFKSLGVKQPIYGEGLNITGLNRKKGLGTFKKKKRPFEGGGQGKRRTRSHRSHKIC